MSRPAVLFPLFADLVTLAGVGPKTAKAMAGLGVERPKDLLFLLPHGGVDRRRLDSVRDATLPATVTVEVTVGAHHPPTGRGRSYRVSVRDAAQDFQIVFFHARGDYLKSLLPMGQRRIISGRAEMFDGVVQLVHPDHVLPPEEADDLPRFEPVYPLTAGLGQRRWLLRLTVCQTCRTGSTCRCGNARAGPTGPMRCARPIIPMVRPIWRQRHPRVSAWLMMRCSPIS